VKPCRYCGTPTTCPPGREALLAVTGDVGFSFDPIVVCPRPECLDRLAAAAALEAREVQLEAGGPVVTAWFPTTAR